MSRSAVVTGAGSGIGRATALALAERGLPVYCVGRRKEPLVETAALIGDAAVVVPADVSTEEGVRVVLDAVDEVAVVVHAAAIEGIHSLSETSRRAFAELIDINVGGPFFLTQALAPRLADGAGVVFIGSVSAQHGRERHAAYAASKAALLGLTTSLAAELAPRVRVNCIAPGATDTPMFAEAITEYVAGLDEGVRETMMLAEKSRLLLARIAEPAEIASAAVYLALDATYSTGTVLAVDGGYSAR